MSIKDRLSAAVRAFAAGGKQPTAFRGWGQSVVEGVYSPARYYENPEDIEIADLRKMWRRDDMVRNSIEMRTLAALSTGFVIEPASDDDRDKEAAEFVRDADLALPGGFFGAARSIQRSALIHGHSAHEPKWTGPLTDQKWRGKRWFAKIMERSATTIFYHLDEYGEVYKVTQEPFTSQTAVEFEPSELILHCIDPMNGNPYGNSPLRTAYRWSFIKDDLVQWWAFYGERYGLPFPMGKYPHRQGTDAQTSADNRYNKELILTIIREMRKNYGVALPKDFEMELLTGQHGSQTDFFETFTAACNRGIARSILIPGLVGETTQSGAGAYALGKEHNDQFVWVLNADRLALENVIDNQIIKPLWAWNFPPTVGMPRFRFKAFTEDNLQQTVEVLRFLADKGGKVSVPEAHKLLHVTMADEGEELLTGGGGSTTDGGLPPNSLGLAERMADRPADTEGEEDEEEEVPKPQKMAGKVRREMTPLERQINFGAINEAEDADAAFAGENLGVIFEGLAYQVEELAGKGNGGRRAR
jgi:phage gp29-like protein